LSGEGHNRVAGTPGGRERRFDTMRGGEARTRRPQYKEYKRVRDAQRFTERLGVGAVDYGGRIDIANLANHALFLAHEQGVPMPAAVRARAFTEAEGDDPTEIAYYVAGFGDAVGEIDINSAHPFWDDPVGVMREARDSHDFSTGDPRHPIAHELGELAMHQSVGGDRFFPLGEGYLESEQAFQQEDLRHIFRAVSDRATQNHSEFVAEVFAALLLGRAELRQDLEVMNSYTKYGGDGIRQYEVGI
jgi:hypothetical protein